VAIAISRAISPHESVDLVGEDCRVLEEDAGPRHGCSIRYGRDSSARSTMASSAFASSTRSRAPSVLPWSFPWLDTLPTRRGNGFLDA
jgi:hypothetical protein